MKVTNLVLVVLIICGVAFNPVMCQGGPLAPPQPGTDGLCSTDEFGHSSCDNSLASSMVDLDQSSPFEHILGFNGTISSMADLAQFVIDHSEMSLGYPALIPDSQLAEVAQVFSIRHAPAPKVVAMSAHFNEVERLVETVLTSPELRGIGHISRKDIKSAVSAVKQILLSNSGFVFRIIEASDSDYPRMHMHQLGAKQAYFAAVHSNDTVYVAVVGAEIMGQFRRGTDNSITTRASVDLFLRNWLLEQWVKLWICPDHPIVYGSN